MIGCRHRLEQQSRVGHRAAHRAADPEWRPAEEAKLSVEALKAADEVFLTSTAGGIVPITRIDGTAIGAGTPGPVTARLVELYWQKHEDPAWTTPVD